MKTPFLLILLLHWVIWAKGQNENICETCQSDDIFLICEKPAEYNGGRSKLYDDLNTKLNFPKKINGRVFIQMTISKDGTACCFKYLLEDVKPKSDFDTEAKESVLKALKELQNWQPAEQRKTTVHFRHTIPIYIVKGKCMPKS
jgi:hypothetical protein